VSWYLLYSNEIDKVETLIEEKSILDSVRSAISKKIEKMQNVNEEVREWYTYWLIINKYNEKGIGFKGVPDESSYLEVGYSISSNYRRKRFM